MSAFCGEINDHFIARAPVIAQNGWRDSHFFATPAVAAFSKLSRFSIGTNKIIRLSVAIEVQREKKPRDAKDANGPRLDAEADEKCGEEKKNSKPNSAFYIDLNVYSIEQKETKYR